MMRYALAALLFLHGIAHLVGFVVPWRLFASTEYPYRTTVFQGRIDLGEWGVRVLGLGWLVAAVCCAVIAVAVLRRSSWWLLGLEILVAVSLILCVLGWPETRFGVLGNGLILVVAFAAIRFSGNEIALRNPTLEELRQSVPHGSGGELGPGALSNLPSSARRFMEHAIAPGTPVAASVLLKMRGEIKLGGWHPFRAEELISRTGGFVWAAAVSMYGIPILGSDRLVAGEGSMAWNLLGFVPVMTASGPDITRSGSGRLVGEIVAWLPSALVGTGVVWEETESSRPRARIEINGEPTEVELEIDAQGALKMLKCRRWGNPGGGEYGYFDFGVTIDEERSFEGFTIPSRVRAGWFVGTERFESEGEFFRATILGAEYS